MTLRLRLFALLVGLAALLAAGEWALVRELSRDLEHELTSAAASVGSDMLRVLRGEGLPPMPAEPGARHVEERVIVVRHRDGAPPAGATRVPEPHAADGSRGADGAPPPPAGAAPPSEIADARLEVHVSGKEPRVLVLRGTVPLQQLPVPTSGVEAAVAGFRRRLLAASLGLAAGALLLGLFVAHRFTRPLRQLADAARRLGEGGFGAAAPPAPGEVGEAIAAFNQMSHRLQELDGETRRLRESQQLSELGEVGRGLAHSLRNPLHALGLALDELAAQAGGQQAAETAAAARRQIRRVDDALRGFLALSAPGGAAAPVDLAAVARDVALEALQARPEGEAPAVAVEAAVAVTVAGVEAEVRAAIQSLVVNAVEASPPGARVLVRVARDGAHAVVTVDDDGAGVPPAVRAKLFTPHVTTKPAGAGVGLYLAHRLATTRYGGDLELAPRPEGGTRATLRLRDREGAATLASTPPGARETPSAGAAEAPA